MLNKKKILPLPNGLIMVAFQILSKAGGDYNLCGRNTQDQLGPNTSQHKYSPGY